MSGPFTVRGLEILIGVSDTSTGLTLSFSAECCGGCEYFRLDRFTSKFPFNEIDLEFLCGASVFLESSVAVTTCGSVEVLDT